MDVSNGIVIALGLGIVFAGLICIIIICSIMGAICKRLVKPQESTPAPAVAPAANTNAPIANKQEIVAAVCACLAEELGTDASNIRVTSFKRV